MSRCLTVGALLVWVVGPFLHAQQTRTEASTAVGYAVPDSERLRISAQFAAGYGHDEAENGRLGFEVQGRVGWAIISLAGRLSERVTYRLDLNPVNESAPLPACGTPTFFFPNEAQTIGPNVRCDNAGDKRVDDYKFLAYTDRGSDRWGMVLLTHVP